MGLIGEYPINPCEDKVKISPSSIYELRIIWWLWFCNFSKVIKVWYYNWSIQSLNIVWFYNMFEEYVLITIIVVGFEYMSVMNLFWCNGNSFGELLCVV